MQLLKITLRLPAALVALAATTTTTAAATAAVTTNHVVSANNAKSAATATATAIAFQQDHNNKKTAKEMGYGVEVAECDADLNWIAATSPDRQTKSHQGGTSSIIRICFRPNEKARDDGIGMRMVESFTWEMEHEGGTAIQVAVKDGKDDGVLSYLNCQEEEEQQQQQQQQGSSQQQTVCFLDTLLGTNFYVNAGSVLGTGVAHLAFGSGDEPIDIEKWMFQADFKIRFVSEGEEMSEEDQADLMQRLKAQHEEEEQAQEEKMQAAAAAATEGEDEL
jgi:hypothetical protein